MVRSLILLGGQPWVLRPQLWVEEMSTCGVHAAAWDLEGSTSSHTNPEASFPGFCRIMPLASMFSGNPKHGIPTRHIAQS
jgi:hypothetical protein